jgi:hypothetical protein
VDALRVDAAEDPTDGAVLAGGVHALKDQQQCAFVLGPQAGLEVPQRLEQVVTHLVAVCLVAQAKGVAGVPVGQPWRVTGRDAGRCQQVGIHRSAV